MNEKNVISIRCPHCFEDTSFSSAKEPMCKKCDKSLVNKRYIKPLAKGATIFMTALMLGTGGGIALDEAFETDRYPLDVEYSIIDSCVSADNSLISRRSLWQKKQISVMALERTQKRVSYKEYQDDEDEFLDEFEKQTKIAAKKIRKSKSSSLSALFN